MFLRLAPHKFTFSRDDCWDFNPVTPWIKHVLMILCDDDDDDVIYTQKTHKPVTESFN